MCRLSRGGEACGERKQSAGCAVVFRARGIAAALGRGRGGNGSARAEVAQLGEVRVEHTQRRALRLGARSGGAACGGQRSEER